MTRDDRFEARLEQRLAAYADEEALGAGVADVGALSTSPSPSRSALRTLGVVAALVLAVLVGLAAASALPDGSGIGVSPSGEASMSPAASASATSTTGPGPTAASTPSAEPTPAPMTGDLPPPGAVAPVGIAYVDELSATDVWTAFSSAGYDCLSAKGAGGEEASIGWTITCERTSGQMRVTVSIPYWTLDRVVGVFMTVLPEPIDGSINDRSLVVAQANLLTRLDYRGADVGGATAWVARALADSGCSSTPCEVAFGQAEFSVQVGERGSRTIRLDGRTIAR